MSIVNLKKDGKNKSQHHENGRVNDGDNSVNLEEILTEEKVNNMKKSKRLPVKVSRIKKGEYLISKGNTGHAKQKNDDIVLEGFKGMGIPEEEIIPRENTYTYKTWKTLGRQVKFGESGVPILIVTGTKMVKDEKTGKEKKVTKVYNVSVFHISQTVPIKPSNN